MVLFAGLWRLILTNPMRVLLVCWLFVLAVAQPAAAHGALFPRFLPIDYHPVSKTLVQEGKNSLLYDYVYRVDIRNSGAKAVNVAGTIKSKLPALVVIDAAASFGTVAAYQNKASSDTITIRAGQYFDRRFDRKKAVGAGWQYANDGVDGIDQQVVGLAGMGGHSIWTDLLASAFYDVKFQFLFQWSFTQGSENAGPVIGTLSPQEPLNDPRPTIRARFEEGSSRIDSGEVRLILDGKDVTANATITSSSISLRPSRALADGDHAVELSVADRAGNRSRASWTFMIDTRAPSTSGRMPANRSSTDATALIGADFDDVGGSGIDIDATVLKVDGVNVTAQASVTANGVLYTPARALAKGTHRVSLTVGDIAGNRHTEEWSFSVVNGSIAISALKPVQGAILPADSVPTISAAFAGTGATVAPKKTVLMVDGRNVTAQAVVTTQSITYTPREALTEGSHEVQLSVTDTSGRVTNSGWSFVTRSIPEITATAPHDILLNAQAQVRITAAYQDRGAGIDPAAIRLLLDGVDVTAQAQVGATQLVLVPAVPLPQGMHVMTLTVADKAGNAATATWRFTIDSGAPVIRGETPKDVPITDTTPRIAASYEDGGDKGSGVEASGVHMWLDNQNVTDRAEVSATGISFTPAAPLAGGIHTVRLTVADRASNLAESIWSFTVDAQGPIAAASLSPAPGSTVAADQAPVIGATFSEGAMIDPARVQLLIDGVAVVPQQVSAAGVRHVPEQPLAEGAHDIRLIVADSNGATNEKRWDFVVRSAPVIDHLLPSEGMGLAAGAAVIIHAQYSDIGSGIDTASVKIRLDGADVTGSADIAADRLQMVAPAGQLKPGTHVLEVQVADKAGNQTRREARFTIEPPASTTISALQPARNSMLPFGAPVHLSAAYADPAGIDPARTRITINDQDVTAAARIDATGFSVEATGLTPGRHIAFLRVANTQGREASAMWTFEIEAPGDYQVWFSESDTPSGVSAPRAEIRVVTASNRSSASEVTLNGLPMTRLSEAAGQVSYGATIDLVQGDNLLTARARYADNQVREAVTTLNYAVAPTVTITSPADRSTLGASVATSPRDLTGNVQRPVTLTGTTSKNVASVTINQQQAAVSGTGWRFEDFFLHEGTNLLTVVATDAQGRVGTASVTLSVDQTAPFLSVEAPLENGVTSANTIDVRGTVNDAVEGYYGAVEPTVTVSGAKGSVDAQVGDKQFLASAVPLEPGQNTLTVTARDQAGNTRGTQVKITRVAAGLARLTIYGGNGQQAVAGSALPQPFTVAALDAAGQPLSGAPVTFDVTRGTGVLSRAQAAGEGAELARNLVVTTDANGLASVWMVLGKQSGPGSNAVRASSIDIVEDAHFVASGQKGPPNHIRPDLGVNQYVAAGGQPLEPLTAVVTDAHENRIANTDVKFSVAAGAALFDNGSDSIIVKTDRNGYAAVRPTLGPNAGPTIVKATPAENGDAFFEATFTLQALQTSDGPTRFSGMVLNDKGQPLPGARMSIGRTALSTTVDEKGRFAFENVPPGKIDLFVDGRTVNLQGQQYPALHFEATAIKGAQNQLTHPVYLPELQMAEAKVVGGDQDVVIRMPGHDGYEMTVFANSVTFPDGSRTGPLVVSPISFDKLPMTPPGGYAGFMAPAATIQPSGARFDPPIQLRIPNTAGLKPGEKKPVYQWDHDLATFVQMGQATVTEDAASLVTDPGTGISKAGWHPVPNPPPPDDCPGSGGEPTCPDCWTLTSSGGKCPVKSCRVTSGGCDDKLYCTTGDTCRDGSCIGTPVEDDKGPANVLETNLAGLQKVFDIVNGLGFPVEIDGIKASLTAQEIHSCCESKQGAKVKGTEAKLEAKLSLGLGPFPIAYRVPFPSMDAGLMSQLMLGFFVSAEVGVGVSGSVASVPCVDKKDCWGGGGSLFAEFTGEAGAIVKDGGDEAVKVTGGLKSGLQAGIELKCDEGVVNATQWNGVTAFVVFEILDGYIHIERSIELVGPKTGDEIRFALPKFGD